MDVNKLFHNIALSTFENLTCIMKLKLLFIDI